MEVTARYNVNCNDRKLKQKLSIEATLSLTFHGKRLSWNFFCMRDIPETGRFSSTGNQVLLKGALSYYFGHVILFRCKML